MGGRGSNFLFLGIRSKILRHRGWPSEPIWHDAGNGCILQYEHNSVDRTDDRQRCLIRRNNPEVGELFLRNYRVFGVIGLDPGLREVSRIALR